MATPISTSFSAYRTEKVPVSIVNLGRKLCAAYAQPADAFGSKGNLQHDSGPHRSARWLMTSPQSRNGADDWSLRGAKNTPRDGDEIAGWDFTPGPWGTAENRRRMAEMTSRVLTAARANDRRLAPMRRFAGTLDGRTVITFECQGGTRVSPYDSSHLDHGHGELWRSLTNLDLSGVAEIITGEDDMSAQAEEILAALASGLPTANGKPFAPHGWQMQLHKYMADIAARDAADETRDRATMAAILALSDALKAGGGTADGAAIVAAIREESEKTRTAVTTLQEENAALRERLAQALGS